MQVEAAFVQWESTWTFIAEWAVAYTQTLGGMTEAGRRAAAELAAQILERD